VRLPKGWRRDRCCQCHHEKEFPPPHVQLPSMAIRPHPVLFYRKSANGARPNRGPDSEDRGASIADEVVGADWAAEVGPATRAPVIDESGVPHQRFESLGLA